MSITIKDYMEERSDDMNQEPIKMELLAIFEEAEIMGHIDVFGLQYVAGVYFEYLEYIEEIGLTRYLNGAVIFREL